MQYITGKHMERRTFIQGMGASLALPFLDAMIPAGRLSAATRADIDATRLVAIEMVHGAAGLQRLGCVTEPLGSRRSWSRLRSRSQFTSSTGPVA